MFILFLFYVVVFENNKKVIYKRLRTDTTIENRLRTKIAQKKQDETKSLKTHK